MPKFIPAYLSDKSFKKAFVDCLKMTGAAAAIGAAVGFAATFFAPVAAATAVTVGAAAGGLLASGAIAGIAVVTWPLMLIASIFSRQDNFEQEMSGMFHSTLATGLASAGVLFAVGGIDMIKNPPTAEKTISAAANSAYRHCNASANTVRVTNDAQGRAATITITCQAR